MTQRDKEILSSQPLFRGVEDELLAAGWRFREYERGETVFAPDSFERALGIVVSGRVRVSKSTGDGGTLIMSTLFPGSIFGAAALFNDSQSYVNSLAAVTPLRVALLSQEDFRRAMGEYPRLGENYVRYLSERILFLNRRIYCLTAGSAVEKLANFLADNLPEGEEAELPVSMTELAKLLNIGRASLYRAMDTLIERGEVRRHGNNITIFINNK